MSVMLPSRLLHTSKHLGRVDKRSPDGQGSSPEPLAVVPKANLPSDRSI